MKLNLWMIANRLSALEPELHISGNAPAVLSSARRAYATNCVHVYQKERILSVPQKMIICCFTI